MEVDISPPTSPFHGFSAEEVPKPIIIKSEVPEQELFNKDSMSSPPESPFHGYVESEIPRPMIIKTECVEYDVEDLEVVEVSRKSMAKTRKNETDDNVFHGFTLCEIPKPIIIKDEPEDITVERQGSAVGYFTEVISQNIDSKEMEAKANDDSFSEDVALESVQDSLSDHRTKDGEESKIESNCEQVKEADLVALKASLQPIDHPVETIRTPMETETVNTLKIQENEEEPILVMVESDQDEICGENIEVSNQEIVVMQTQDMQVIHGNDIEVVQSEDIVQTNAAFEGQACEQRETDSTTTTNDVEQITIIETGEDHETVKTVKREEIETKGRLPRNIQILDENGSAILLLDKESESDDSDLEDREFTVIVDEDESEEDNEDEELNLEKLDRLPLGEKTSFEGETIEDILAQFESESKNRAVSCPSCKKCFVSSHFLNIHIKNKSTLCDLCNTQCCTAQNLRNHKNLHCDLSKRKRNIDLIAQETALLGRKPIEPEKYYNLPLDSSDEENEIDCHQRKIVRSINDQKYECGICGQYVKILNSHMKFVHGVDELSLASKFKCPECGILVTNLAKHKALKHDSGNRGLVSDSDLEVVRCKQQGCDTFFNNTDELAEHQKRDHTDQVRLACGMGGCNAVFDSRGSLRKHRTETHPELEEFKPVDLEHDDPDREAELTVACPVCERKFKHKNTCTVHIKVHHLGWSKRKMFECPDCMKGFDNKKNMELHREAIHLGIRTICPLCDKPVTRLDLHVRMVHTDLPEWPCPDCGKKFKRKFDLNRHRVTVHLGVRNFPCDLCGKRFADMKDMTRHKNAVHYGMKIKWNSKKHKEERKRRKEMMEKKLKYSNLRRDKLDKHGRQRNVNIPVEFIDTGSGAAYHIEEGSGLDGSSVMLDPVLQSQMGSVQEEDRDPRVLIQADSDNSGGFRFVVLHEDENENDIEIEEEAETHIILEAED